MSTFGLREWDAARNAANAVRARTTTGDHIHAFLMEHGPTDVEDIIEHAQWVTGTTRRNVQDVINHDPAKRFVKTPDRRVAANPFHKGFNPTATTLTVVSDGQRYRPGPILHQSELLWLNRYVQALNDLRPPLPQRVAPTGSRATGFAQGDALELTVVVPAGDAKILEPKLDEIAAATSDIVPGARPNISVLSPEEWNRKHTSRNSAVHYNVWLASLTAP